MGGFDERYQGWGSEDVQFGLDLASRGYHLHFAVDFWAEHQVHPRRTLFHDLELSGKDCPLHLSLPGAQELQIVDQQAQLPTVLGDLFGYYFVNDLQFGPETKTLLAYPDVHYVSDLKELRIHSELHLKRLL